MKTLDLRQLELQMAVSYYIGARSIYSVYTNFFLPFSFSQFPSPHQIICYLQLSESPHLFTEKSGLQALRCHQKSAFVFLGRCLEKATYVVVILLPCQGYMSLQSMSGLTGSEQYLCACIQWQHLSNRKLWDLVNQGGTHSIRTGSFKLVHLIVTISSEPLRNDCINYGFLRFLLKRQQGDSHRPGNKVETNCLGCLSVPRWVLSGEFPQQSEAEKPAYPAQQCHIWET